MEIEMVVVGLVNFFASVVLIALIIHLRKKLGVKGIFAVSKQNMLYDKLTTSLREAAKKNSLKNIYFVCIDNRPFLWIYHMEEEENYPSVGISVDLSRPPEKQISLFKCPGGPEKYYPLKEFKKVKKMLCAFMQSEEKEISI
jgi:hypothetical protein